MWKFNEIFSANTDKANLITALISVIAAVLVVYFTHALSTRRSRIELRARKMEELFSAVTQFGELGLKLMHEVANPCQQVIESSADYSESHNKVVMLSSIYFNEISINLEKMHLLVILTKDEGREDISRFPDKLKKYIAILSDVKNKIAKRAGKIV